MTCLEKQKQNSLQPDLAVFITLVSPILYSVKAAASPHPFPPHYLVSPNTLFLACSEARAGVQWKHIRQESLPGMSVKHSAANSLCFQYCCFPVTRNVPYVFSDRVLVHEPVAPGPVSVVEYCRNRIATSGANNSNDEVSTSQHLAP